MAHYHTTTNLPLDILSQLLLKWWILKTGHSHNGQNKEWLIPAKRIQACSWWYNHEWEVMREVFAEDIQSTAGSFKSVFRNGFGPMRRRQRRKRVLSKLFNEAEVHLTLALVQLKHALLLICRIWTR
ncbi:hypothetical protein OIDMADRAFT_35759 [Oidiodendron maius Zn]|uniref:Uncharacterized protein n=1 Tax=Oidiodendron maius (strain Zn) TaxID=913774 RepID=A0A0C3GSL5_OIDMZ|nr:hypothetical protein OIDMADRAFT_35759 [Oidiodendron maius Zn]